MDKMKLELIEKIINSNNEKIIIAWYEIMINDDIDYITDLFKCDYDFDEFIDQYKSDCKCGEE